MMRPVSADGDIAELLRRVEVLEIASRRGGGGDTDHPGAGLNSIEIGAGAVAAYDYSAAVGVNAVPSGIGGNAFGTGAVAAADGTAVGWGALARPFGTAVGSTCEAEDSSVAVGENIQMSTSVTEAVAVGRSSKGGIRTVTVGFEAGNGNEYTDAVLLGRRARGGAQTVAIGAGQDATSTGDDRVQIGYGTKATTPRTVVIGSLADATGDNAIAIGYNAEGLAEKAVAIGSAASATHQGSWALGDAASTTGTFQTHIKNGKVIIDGGFYVFNLAGTTRYRIYPDASGNVLCSPA